MSVEITLRQIGDVSILDCKGRIILGADGSSNLRDTVRGYMAKGHKKMLLNLAETSYIDSSGIGELVSGFTTLSNHGGQLKLLGMSQGIKDLIAFTKLYTIFEVYDNEAEAVASFQ